MMLRISAVLFSVLSVVSCVRTVAGTPRKRVKAPPSANTEPAPVPKTGMRTTMDRQVLNALDAGDGDLRVRALRQRLASSPDDVKLRLELAQYYRSMGFPDIAIEHYRLAASRFPGSGEVAVQLARALDSLGMRREARQHLEAFVAAYPGTSADASSWLGIYRDEAGELKEAEPQHREALKLRPNSDAFHNNLGYNLLLQGRVAEAVGEFRNALAIAPSSALARNNLATALAGQLAESAVSELKQVSDPASAHNNMAAVLLEQGKLDGARRELGLALGYNKYHPEALSNMRLLTELDAVQAELARGGPESPWQRVMRMMGDVLLGPKQEPKSKQSAATVGTEDHPAPTGTGSH